MPASFPPRFTSMDSERHQPTFPPTHAGRRAPVAQCSRLGESEEFRSWAPVSFTCRTLCHIVLRPPHRRRAKNGTPRTKHTVDRGADGTAGAVVPRRPSDRIRGKYHTPSPVCPFVLPLLISPACPCASTSVPIPVGKMGFVTVSLAGIEG